jgi:hypothetical protein
MTLYDIWLLGAIVSLTYKIISFSYKIIQHKVYKYITFSLNSFIKNVICITFSFAFDSAFSWLSVAFHAYDLFTGAWNERCNHVLREYVLDMEFLKGQREEEIYFAEELKSFTRPLEHRTLPMEHNLTRDEEITGLHNVINALREELEQLRIDYKITSEEYNELKYRASQNDSFSC